jgi:serine/threonine protein kinase
MLAPDTVLQSRYRIVRLLGQGGMGAVYEAIDERLDTTVALKETMFADERLRKQFEREARLLARLHHPALPRVSDHFSEGDGQFLVMQFIPGDDLSQMMARKQGPFPADQVLTWGDQLLDALDYLHTQDPQIIHRDIKPQNLKLTGRGQIILLDFGLAKGQSGGVSVVTTSASIFGYTPNYAPLEQIQGLGTDARSDIYALSATLYHLVTFVKPPDALTRAAALVNGQPDPLVPASDITGSIGTEISAVLARGMSQSRDQRYTTASAMREALKGTTEVATLVGRSEAATIIHAPSTATLANTRQAEAAPTALKGETTVVRTKESANRRRVPPWAIGVAALVLIGIVFGCYYALQHRNNNVVTVQPTPTPSPVDNSVTASSSPTPAPQQVSVATPAPSEEKKAVATNRSNEPAKKADKGKHKDKTTDETDTEEETQNDQHQLFEFKNAPGFPTVPETPDPNNPNAKRNQRRYGTTVRNLPDGTQVMTLPDGTRVVTNPNGTQRVYRRGEKLPVRRQPRP